METALQIADKLKKKNYVIIVNGNNKSIRILLKTAFENEVMNQINEIKIIAKSLNDELTNDQLEVIEMNYKNKKHKFIQLKY